MRNMLRGLSLLLFVGLFAAVGWVVPFHDDWTYSTAPNVAFRWAQLLPTDSFWRPFDVLWGALMGWWPDAFPYANRLAVILGHCLNAWLLYSVFERKGGCRPAAFAAGVFFAVNSAIAATIVNTDTINQVWSFTFGLLALRAALAERNLLSYALVFVSILFKESGVSWLAVVPLIKYEEGLRARESGAVKALLKAVAFGASALAAYFALRFLLRGGVTLGDSSYRLGFDPVSIVKNLGIAIIGPMSGADFLALATGRRLLFACTVFLGVAFWFVLLVQSRDRMGACIPSLLLFASLALALAIPHCCFLNHHPAEMHFYPVLFAGAWLVARLDSFRWTRGRALVAAAVFVVLNLTVWGDKLTAVFERDRRTRELLASIETMGLDYSKLVYFVLEPSAFETDSAGGVRPLPARYSVFSQSAAHGVDFGRACRKFNGWQDFDCRIADASDPIPVGAQKVFLSR